MRIGRIDEDAVQTEDEMTEFSAPARAHMTSLQPVWLAWQAELPGVLEHCRRQWGLTVNGQLARRVGSSLYRVTVRGRDAVLKLSLPDRHSRLQGDLLAAARGRGYVHLYDRDDDRGALLIEDLGPSLDEQVQALYRPLPAAIVLSMVEEASEFAAPVVSALQEAWSVPLSIVPEPDEATHKAARARDLITHLADELDARDRHAAAIDRALMYAEQRLSAWPASDLVVCHGDAHIGNLLQVRSPRPGAPEGYVFVDPDGVACEAEYDLGTMLRGFNRVVMAADDPVVMVRGWCARLAAGVGADAEAVWQWSLIERVASGLYLTDQGWPERGRPYLDAATWLIARKGA